MAEYTKVFDNPYPSGWEDLPSENTPITANALQEHTDAIEHIEEYLDNNPIKDSTDVEWNQIQKSGKKIAEITINGQTTDVYADEGGQGGGEEYDGTERVIGTWFGKPLYRKSFNNLVFSDSSAWYNAGSHNIANLKDVVRCSYTFKNSSNQFLLSDVMYEYGSKTLSILLTSQSILVKSKGSDTNWSNGTFSLTLEYTKVGD